MKVAAPTKQQQTAIDARDVSVALSAGAGCGKTSVLTQRFLAHLEPDGGQDELSTLVAITFTERAAREMRDRIRAQCRDRLRAAPADEAAYWQAIVRELDSARINTIHGFCASLLRSHAVEAGIDPLFDLLNESLSASFLAKNVRAGLHTLLAADDPDAAELVFELGLSKTEHVLASLVTQRYRINFAELREVDVGCVERSEAHHAEGRWASHGSIHPTAPHSELRTPNSELPPLPPGAGRGEGNEVNAPIHAPDVQSESHSALRTPHSALELHSPIPGATRLALRWQARWFGEVVPRLLRDAVESAAVATVLELLRAHVPEHPVMRARREALLEQIPKLAEATDPEGAIESLRESALVRGGGRENVWESEEVYYAVRDAFIAFRKRLDKLRDQLDLDRGALLRGAEIGMCALRVAERVGRFYDERKEEASLLDFDDLLLLTRNLLRDHAGVRRRAAAGIRLLMVDEFQDTDPVQNELVRLLCGEGLLDGRLFIVGDAKQSIYRFRRAEPRVFHELRSELPQEGRLPLSLNFRSQPQILAFINAVFDGARGLGPEYEPLEPHVPQFSPVPSVEFLFAANGAAQTRENDEGEPEAADDGSVAARRRREADWIARRLTQLLTDRVPRVRDRDEKGEPHLREARPKDIAILFRALSDVRYYEAALRNYGLDYYVVGGRAFFAQQEVFDVINLCRWLDDPADRPALVGVLRSPMFSLSDDAIFGLGRNPERDLFSVSPAHLPEQQQDQMRFAAGVLDDLLAQKDRLPIAQLLNLAVERTGYDAALLTEFMGSRKLANLRKLVDMAREFDRSGLFTLGDFVDRLRDAVADEVHEPLAATHPESSDVIRLMTIHQSKGLEFPIVVVADCDRPTRGPGLAAAFDAQLGPVVALPSKFGIERRHLGTKMRWIFEVEEDLNESLRLFYVATTRAADHLILSANLAKPGVGTSSWLKALSERFDLLTGQPRLGPTAGGVSILAKYASLLPEIRVHRTAPDPVIELKVAAPRGIPLSRLREAVEQTEPGELPTTLRVIPPDFSARHRFSVSEIETADQQLRPCGALPPLPPGEGRGEGKEAGLPARADTPRGEGAKPEGKRRSTPPSPPVTSRQRLLFDSTFESPDGPAPASAPPVGATSLAAAEQLGTLVHSAIERIDFRNPQDAAILVDTCCSSGGARVDEATRAAAIECVTHILASPLCAELAAARQIHREIEFLLSFPLSGDGCTISGTIDCLFESSRGQWGIIDYKTGLHAEGTPAGEVLAPYEIQLGLYALAVEQLLHRLPDRIELVFMRRGVERIPFEPNPRRLTDIRARVNRAVAHLRGHK